MKTFRDLLIFFSAICLCGCVSTTSRPYRPLSGVGYEFDSDFDFFAGEKFAVIMPETPSPMSPLLRKRILQEVALQLESRNYTKVSERENADIWITVHGTSRQVVDTVTYSNVYYTSTYRRGGWLYYGGYPGTFVTTREEGTLILDIINAKSRELVWRGYGTKTLSGTPSDITDREIQTRSSNFWQIFRPWSFATNDRNKQG